MSAPTITQNELAAVKAEQVRAYFNDANELNLAGAVVYSILVYAVHDFVPWWTWVPELSFLYVVTLVRTYLIRQYHRTPEYRSSAQWEIGQAAGGGLAGICWGLANTAMLAYLPDTLQLFVLTVSVVAAATSMTEGFSLVTPPRAFALGNLVPPALWLLTVGDRLHYVLAVLILMFIPISFVIGNKKNRVFLEAQRLRFRNEALVRELSQQHKLLESASKSKSRFLAAASHDLRQPMAALMIFLEQLEFEKQLSVSGKDVLDHAQQATASLCNLLDGLLDISRLDGHAVKPRIRSFAIQAVLDELEKEFHQVAEQKGIRIRISPSSAVIKSDFVLMQQILRNLVSNALRYTTSGRVLVGCRHRNGMLAIEVHDTGIGIAEDQLSRVFEEFYQVDNPERDRQQGLGLGLSIVDRAAKLLGHPVAFASRLGKGSTFSVTVPLAIAAIDETDAAKAAAVPCPELAGQTIAIIENEGSIRIGIQNLLQSWGCRVVVADSAAGMLEQIEKSDAVLDLVVSDFGLKGSMNGVDAIAAIRQRYGNELPALLFTGDISKETQLLARNAGMPILYKPAKAEALRKAITSSIFNANCQETSP